MYIDEGFDDDSFTMLIGHTASGRVLEVGYIASDNEALVIVHAMPARLKYLR